MPYPLRMTVFPFPNQGTFHARPTEGAKLFKSLPLRLVIYSASNENFVPVNIGFTSSDFDSNSIDEKIESTDDCAIEPVEQAGSGALELGVWFERFQNRTR